MKKILIVGAGLGGLTTALRLAKRGYQVELVEKNAQAGGRLNQIKKDGFTFDIGPSFFSMPYEFDEFARDCAIRLPFEFVELDPLYSVSFRNNPKTYTLYKDIDKLAEQFSDVEPDFKRKMQRYLDACEALYNDTVDVAIKTNFNSLPHYFLSLLKVNPIHLPTLFRSFWAQIERYFDSKEAREIVSLIAFFLGRTPFDTSAVYTLLSYIEFRNNGYHNVKGGMYQIVTGLLKELDKAGVKLHYQVEIDDFEEKDGKLMAMLDTKGGKWTADAFVVNSDAAFFRGRVLKKKTFSEARLQKMEWTMGYLTFYIGLNAKLEDLNHHNYFLGSNYRDYAQQVLTQVDMAEKPYYYVNVLSRSNPDCAPEGCESLFFVCPVPNLLHKKDWSDKEQIVDAILHDFSERIGRDISPLIVSRTVFSPVEWEKNFNLYQGSGLGLSHKMLQIGGFRPSNKDEDYQNVFYVGASTVPGAGLPMAVISSKLVTERIVEAF